MIPTPTTPDIRKYVALALRTSVNDNGEPLILARYGRVKLVQTHAGPRLVAVLKKATFLRRRALKRIAISPLVETDDGLAATILPENLLRAISLLGFCVVNN